MTLRTLVNFNLVVFNLASFGKICQIAKIPPYTVLVLSSVVMLSLHHLVLLSPTYHVLVSSVQLILI